MLVIYDLKIIIEARAAASGNNETVQLSYFQTWKRVATSSQNDQGHEQSSKLNTKLLSRNYQLGSWPLRNGIITFYVWHLKPEQTIQGLKYLIT